MKASRRPISILVSCASSARVATWRDTATWLTARTASRWLRLWRHEFLSWRHHIYVLERLRARVLYVMPGLWWNVHRLRSFECKIPRAFDQSCAGPMENHQRLFVFVGRMPPDGLTGLQAHESAAHSRRLGRAA